ncbi:MAG: CD225/dispanin family protein [Muribaculaceae bacterium]
MATKYWVNIDGIQSGPISRDELANIDFNPEVTYVWHEELDDWQRIDRLSEFADIVAAKQKAAAESAEQSEDSEQSEHLEESTNSEHLVTPPPVPQPAMSQPPMPQPPVAQPPMPQPPVAPEAEAPTNLVWAVIVTVMCCQITGVIAIVYGVMTSSANSAGNYEKARRYSDIAQIWVMVSIVLGLIYMPIALLMMML